MDYVAVEQLDGDNKYDAGEHGLQVTSLRASGRAGGRSPVLYSGTDDTVLCSSFVCFWACEPTGILSEWSDAVGGYLFEEVRCLIGRSSRGEMCCEDRQLLCHASPQHFLILSESFLVIVLCFNFL